MLKTLSTARQNSQKTKNGGNTTATRPCSHAFCCFRFSPLSSRFSFFEFEERDTSSGAGRKRVSPLPCFLSRSPSPPLAYPRAQRSVRCHHKEHRPSRKGAQSFLRIPSLFASPRRQSRALSLIFASALLQSSIYDLKAPTSDSP